MSEPMLVDVQEPGDIFSLIHQVIPCVRESINDLGYADYKWPSVGGEAHRPAMHQVERKLWVDILSDLDAVEDQLRREAQAHPNARLKLLVEGIATSHPDGTVVWLPTKGNKKLMFPAKTFRLPLQAAYAWFYQVSQYMEVYCTPDMASTATALVAFYKADQKEEHEHRTFHRHFKVVTFHPNPQVQKLMALASGVGETRAVALIQRFGTCWNVINADPKQLQAVEGIGLKVSLKLLREIGRPDV